MTTSTYVSRFENIVETTASAGTAASPSVRTVYERIKQILRYDVRSIGRPDQEWFWTDAWQEKERQADADIEAGRTTTFSSGTQLLEYLSGSD